MTREKETFTGLLLDEECELTLRELSQACSVHAERIIALVEEGILEPQGKEIIHWRFTGPNLLRARTALRLQSDLGVNLPGTALALDLLEEIEQLRLRLRSLENHN